MRLEYKLIQGDCLEDHEIIPDGSVDLILTDPPYGTMKGIGAIAQRDVEKDKFGWDTAIEPTKLFNIANRILRKNGKLILFSQEPYTSRLITERIPNIPFSYRAIWQKNDFANHLSSAKSMLGYFEDIVIFSKKDGYDCLHPLREYAFKLRKYVQYSRTKFLKLLGYNGCEHFLDSPLGSSQFKLCAEKGYNELIKYFSIDKLEYFKDYKELSIIDKEFKNRFPSIFNLWEGNKTKSNILYYKKEYTNRFHPTQKPTLLLEDLIKTFSNPQDLVVDLTMGSGSTGVACKRTQRRFIGFENDKAYFDIAENRIMHDTGEVKSSLPEKNTDNQQRELF